MDKMKFYNSNNKVIVLLSMLTLLFFTACQSTDNKSEKQFTLSDLVNNEWQLTSLNDQVIPLTKNGPELTFSNDGKVVGFSGCNRFKASFSLSKNTITISPLMMTRRFCATTAELEVAFTNMLETVYLPMVIKKNYALKTSKTKS